MSPLLFAALATVFRSGGAVRPFTSPPVPTPPVTVKMSERPIIVAEGATLMPGAPIPPGWKGSVPDVAPGTTAPVDPVKEPAKPADPGPKAHPTWFDSEVRRRIQISGRRTLGMQFQNVSGDTGAYDSLTNYGQGLSRFTDSGSMQVQGKQVLGFLDFQMSLTDNRFHDPQNERYTLRYQKKGFDVAYGTIQGSLLNTNPMVSFSRALEGTTAGYASGRAQVRYLRSEARGDARTITLTGTNSPGPYYLQSGRIVNDSLRVLLDGKVQRLGTDFNLDADLGAITFLEKSVAPTSTIVVTYEAFGLDNRRGGIQGAGASYDMGKFGRVGFSTVRQTSAGATSTNLRRESFQGFGNPATPYYLQFEPLPGTIQVAVDGIVQVPGVPGSAGGDYAFDPTTPTLFYFHRFIPNTQTILVTYRPKVTGTVSGDRSVTGVDYRLPLGSSRPKRTAPPKDVGPLVAYIPRGIFRWLGGAKTTKALPAGLGLDYSEVGTSYLQAYTATGSAAGGQSGTARGIAGQYDIGGFIFRGAVRDTPVSFVSVEQTGFNRNERATEMSLTKRMGPASYRLESTNSLVYAPISTVPGGNGSAARLTSMAASANFASEKGIQWSLQQRRATAERALTGSADRQLSQLDTTSLTASRRTGRLGLSAGLDRQTGFGPVYEKGVPTTSHVAIESSRLGVDYSLGRGLSLSGRTALSKVSSGEKSGSGTDTSLSLSLAPIGAWSGAISYARSDSGALSTLGGFADSFGAGYGSSGFSGGVNTSPTGYGGSAISSLSMTTNYRAGERLNLSGRMYQQTSSGSVTSNASTRALGFGATYDLRGGNLFSLSLDQSATSFLAAGAERSESSTLSFFLSGAPQGPWSYRLGVNTLASSGGAFAQSAFGMDAALSHRIDDRQRLSFAASLGRTRGYYPQDDNSFSMLYDYRLFGNVGLVGAYRWRALKNYDNVLTAGAFRSSGFSLELSFDFSR